MDASGWRLKVQDGRQTWHYTQDPQWPQTFCDQYWLGIHQVNQVDLGQDCFPAP